LGRHRKPLELNALHGEPGKRKKPEDVPKAEPLTTMSKRWTPPAHFDWEAHAEWHRLVEEFRALKMLTVIDRGSLSAYCTLWSRWIDAEEKMRATGGAVVTTSNGNLIQNPWLAVINRSIDAMHKIAQEFGMTPASRPKLGRQSRAKESAQGDDDDTPEQPQPRAASEPDSFESFLEDGATAGNA
jgi:P27 family predicted phage terminase small subunit